MKNKLFKIGKPMLSIVIATAILAASLFVVVPGISFNASAATVTDTWDGTLATEFASGSGTKEDPYIIATAEQLALAALGASTKTVGKYFKVVDNATFDLSGMKEITLDSTVGDVMTADINKIWRAASDGMKTFAGYFDGNGVVIYNMYAKGHGYAGLFPFPDNNNADKAAWIKNITLLNSRSHGYHYSGGIVGAYHAPDTHRTLTIENCMVYNCWISDNGDTNPACHRTSGIIAGSVTHNNTTIKNCFAKDNVTSSTDINGGLVGQTSAYCPGVSIQSCITIGSLPYPTVNGTKKIEKHLNVPSTYSGVYTTENVDSAYAANQVKKVAEADMKGPAAKNEMPDLDWGVWIAFEGELPDYRANHNLVLEQNDNATHNVKCSDCGKAMAETHNMVENALGTIGTCECGYSAPVTERRTDVWDGSFDSNFPGGSGTEADPYIIKTAEQMAYVALKIKSADSDSKYYKVAPNMVFNMNGLVGIDMNSTAEEVKTAKLGKNWTGGGDNATTTFAGYFDGNGVIVYNVYSKGAYGGLFPNITANNNDKSLVVKNITLMASFMQGYHQSGGIVGIAQAKNGEDFFTIENCAVKNCYISDNGNTNPATQKIAGAIVGNITHNNTLMTNCFAIDNIVSGGSISSGLIGNCSLYCSGVEIKNSVAIGTSAYPVHNGGTAIDAKLLDVNTYSYVYTDQPVSGFGKNQIRMLTINQMSDVNAPQNMKLDFGKYWFANKGVLDLLVCHNIEGAVNPDDGYAGHTAVCKACGLSGVVVLNHQYNDDYSCTVCGFNCDHKNDEYITVTEFKDMDCITPKHTKSECACGYLEQKNHSEVTGHKFEKTDAKAPTCAQDGNIEYWTCENCECIFLTDDIMAPYETAVSESDVTLKATGIHTVITDSEGKIVYFMDDESHWTACDVCSAKLSRVEHTIKYTDDGSTSHDGICEICLYEAAEDEKHTFNIDSEKCLDCKWVCSHEGTIEAVETSAATCDTEGVSVAHYRCTVCDVRFEDAAATVEVEKQNVVIEKLGHKHLDVDANGTPVQQFTETHHWYNCEVCGKGDYAEHNIVEDTENYEGVYKWCEDEIGYGCNYSTFDYKIENEDLNVTITAPTNAFTKDVITDVFKINKTDLDYEKVRELFDKVGYESFEAYEISPNQEIAEGSKATITTVIPDIYGLRATFVFVDLENGKIIPMESEITTIPDPNAKKGVVDVEIPIISTTTDTFGYFAIVSTLEVPEDTQGGTNGNINGDNGTVSPPTGDDTLFATVIITILASATLLFVRKAKI